MLVAPLAWMELVLALTAKLLSLLLLMVHAHAPLALFLSDLLVTPPLARFLKPLTELLLPTLLLLAPSIGSPRVLLDLFRTRVDVVPAGLSPLLRLLRLPMLLRLELSSTLPSSNCWTVSSTLSTAREDISPTL